MNARLLLAATAAPLLLLAGTVAPAAAPGAPHSPVSATSAQACPAVDQADLRRPYSFRYGLTGDELQSQFFDTLAPSGWRPRRLTGYRTSGGQRFATRWVQAPGPEWTARFGLTGNEFHVLFNQLRATHRPVDVSGYNTPGGATRYAVVWERNPTNAGWKVHRDVSRDGMQSYVDQYGSSGWRPTRVEAYQLDGRLRYVSTWVRANGCGWRMHNRMTREQYQSRLDGYAGQYRLVHLDSFVDGGRVFYAGIWWRQASPGFDVRSNRDWYLFQRIFNNNDCAGRVLENFYVTDVPGGVRYGGVWTASGAAPAGPASSLEARVRRELHCAPGRAGAAIVNVTTGAQTLLHSDTSFGTSSTIKSAILYALLRRIDATADNLTTTINVGAQYGNNQGSTLTANGSFTLQALATTMIRNSNNWATNRLIDRIGMAQVNAELTALGLSTIRLRRYMTGTGAPSAQGNSGSGGDYVEGFDNTATPREYARFLQLMHTNGGNLGRGSWTFFWNTLALNSGAHDAVLDAGVGTSWPTFAALAEKAGSNTWSSAPEAKPQLPASHLQRSAAGRLVLSNGQVVVYAAFVDEADAAPGATPLQNMLDCVVLHAVRQYTGQTTGADVGACRAG